MKCIKRKKAQAMTAPRHNKITSGIGRTVLKNVYITRDMPVDMIDVTAGSTIKLYGFMAI